MSVELLQYMHGALVFGCFVIGLKFLKYWRLSRDRFFVFFAIAFWIFALGWGLRVAIPASAEHGHLMYVPRLVAFVAILFAIFDKNRRSSRE